jgi:hypothetical protein
MSLAKVVRWKMPGSFWSGSGYNFHLTDVKILAQQLEDIRSKYDFSSAKGWLGGQSFCRANLRLLVYHSHNSETDLVK